MKTVIFFSLAFIFGSCRQENKAIFNSENEKQFYTNFEGWGYIRIPLIFPYEILAEDLDDNWHLKLSHNSNIYYDINEIKKFAIMDSVILIHSSEFIHSSIKNQKSKCWFALIPSKKIEMAFSNEVDLLAYVKQYNIELIKWMDVQSAFYQFKDTGCLPWIMGCGGI